MQSDMKEKKVTYELNGNHIGKGWLHQLPDHWLDLQMQIFKQRDGVYPHDVECEIQRRYNSKDKLR